MRLKTTSLIFAILVFLPVLSLSPVSAQEQQGMDHMDHSAMEHRTTDHAAMGHETPAEPAQPHVHPVADPEESQVGLDEKLGATIPLDLLFIDEQGRQVRLKDLITSPTVIAPVYYKCPNVCNFLQGGLAQVLGEINLTPNEGYKVLSISFDETDTPEQARQSKATYFQAIGKPFPDSGWRFLTGQLEEIRKLTDSAGYRFERSGKDFLHPVAIFIVSPEGKIVRYLHGTSFLPMDLTLALVEASEGRIGPTIRKVVSYCFSYDPEGKRYVFNLMRVSATVILTTAGIFFLFLALTGPKRKKTPRGQ